MNIEIITYSEKSFAVFGEETRNIKDKLMKAHGKFNRYLRHPNNPEERTPGYIFSNKQLEAVKAIVNQIN